VTNSGAIVNIMLTSTSIHNIYGYFSPTNNIVINITGTTGGSLRMLSDIIANPGVTGNFSISNVSTNVNVIAGVVTNTTNNITFIPPTAFTANSGII
jgi:hypothetical protein